jgi:hypothetical protein
MQNRFKIKLLRKFGRNFMLNSFSRYAKTSNAVACSGRMFMGSCVGNKIKVGLSRLLKGSVIINNVIKIRKIQKRDKKK